MSQVHPLRRVVEICEEVLSRARESSRSSARVLYGHGLFAKAVQHGRSIVTLASGEHETDVGAICVLSRCVMEVQKAASYFLEVGLSKDEAHMRLHLFLLNHSTDLEKIHSRFSMSKSDFWHRMGREWSLDELAKNPVFMSLDEKHRENLSRGKSPYLHARYLGPRLLPLHIESGLYTLFSHSAHSFSLGLPEVGGGAASPAGAVNSFFLAVDSASLHLASFGLLYWRMRHRAIKQFLPHERRALEEAASPALLIKRLDEIRVRYPKW
ncbi:MAG: hypothetical protein HY018_03480 [Hydrogenophilales bacterium]|nr:hypothetical protein [Hydrogenophilales bacterium]